MPSTDGYSRRTVVGVGLGGLGTLLSAGLVWNGYTTRHAFRMRNLTAENRSPEAVELAIVVGTDLEEPRHDRTHRLEAAGHGDGGDTQHIAGHWLKQPREWAIEVATDTDAATDGDTLVLSPLELNERADTGWGSDTLEVTIVVTADGDLESEVRQAG